MESGLLLLYTGGISEMLLIAYVLIDDSYHWQCSEEDKSNYHIANVFLITFLFRILKQFLSFETTAAHNSKVY